MAYLWCSTDASSHGNTGSVTILYSTSSSGATHTLSITSAYCDISGNTAGSPHVYLYYEIAYGNSTLKSGVLRADIGSGDSSALSISSDTTMTHAAQTKPLKLTITKAEFYWTGGSQSKGSKSASTNVSIAARPSYAVTYNANGGSGAPASQTKWYGESLSLSNAKPTRTSYAFYHWNTNANNSGTTYNPGASYTGNAALALYAIWNPIIAYDANGGSGAPASQTKTYGTSLTLQTGKPTRAGYTFGGWNTAKDGTGASYSAGGTYTSNVAATLYAQWVKNPEAPNISSLTAIRCNSSGAQQDDGTYCKVTAAWSIDTTNVSGNTATVTGAIQALGGATVPFTISSGGSGTSGTATALVPGCDTDTQYIVSITVRDKVTSTIRVAIMTSASFVLDLKAGGKAMGIGSAAPASGLEIGWAAQFDKAVTMLLSLSVGGDLAVTGNLSAPQLTVVSATSDVASANTSGGWTISSQAAHTYGKIVSVQLTFSKSSACAAGSSQTLGTLANGYRPKAQQGLAAANGVGSVSTGGSITFRPTVELPAGTSVVIGATYIKG